MPISKQSDLVQAVTASEGFIREFNGTSIVESGSDLSHSPPPWTLAPLRKVHNLHLLRQHPKRTDLTLAPDRVREKSWGFLATGLPTARLIKNGIDLEFFKGDSLPVDGDEAAFMGLGRNAVPGDLAVVDERHVEEIAFIFL